MSDRRRAPLWAWIVAFGLLLAGLGGAALMVARPALVQRPLIAVHPLAPALTVTTDQAREAHEVFATAGKARLDDAHATALLRPVGHPTVALFELSATPAGQTALRLSLREGASFMNIEMEGVLELRDGRVATCRAERLRVSGWDMSATVAGQELAPIANQRLDEARAQLPDWDAHLAELGRFHLADGRFHARR